MELNYTCNLANQILPSLGLPHFKPLRVSSPRPGQEQKLADVLPYSGYALPAGATDMGCSNQSSLQLYLSGNRTDVSLSTSPAMADQTIAHWFSDGTRIPFNQIEELKVEGCSFANSPANLFAFENRWVP